jgi:hypothetical protein
LSLIIHFPCAHDYLLYIDGMDYIPSDSGNPHRMNAHEFYIVKILNPFFGIQSVDATHPIVSDWMYTQVKEFGDGKSYLLNYKFPLDKLMSEKRSKKALIRGDRAIKPNEVVNLASGAHEIYTFSILNFTDIVSIASDIPTVANIYTPPQYAYIYVLTSTGFLYEYVKNFSLSKTRTIPETSC